ncbi:MAG: FAD-binding oxidoreductase [Candidatus Thorarchaeota archaeon]|nr:FAD-binding oxidoreductase [Candidatus Thorarchaeota archaeon]
MKLRDYVIGANASMYYRLNFKKIKGVYYPKTEQQVVDIVRDANEHGFGVTPKGGGSGLSGACTGGNAERVMVNSLQMREILNVSKDQGYIDTQPGATPDEINALLASSRMKFWVAPSSRDIATVGGILSTDGGGNDTWVNGTMRDNTQRVKMVLYNGKRLTVDWDGVKCEDPDLERDLNKHNMTLHDVASAHGTLGYITEMRLTIKPITSVPVVGGVVNYSDNTAAGEALTKMIAKQTPVTYGEVIASAHADVREGFTPPLHVIEIPEEDLPGLEEIVDFKQLPSDEVARMKDIRIKLPKRQPKEGGQVALFEGYGFHAESLKNMQDRIDEIDALLRRHDLEPFAKYGHGPSKWYLGDNTPAYGIILHSREIRPEGKPGKEVYQAVLDIVQLCKKLKITPKPEHKWPFSDEVKNARLTELRQVLGAGFNEFMLDPEYNDILASMV